MTERSPFLAKIPRLPKFTSSMFAIAAAAPSELTPLYAALAIVHNDMSGARPNCCVPICYQLASALAYLGLKAEPLAACATVFSREDLGETVTDVGVWQETPIIRADGTTNGHVILWADSFGRMVDPTVVQEPRLLAAARRDPDVSLPCILPIPGGRDGLLSTQPKMIRGPFVIGWTTFPDGAVDLAPMLHGDLGEAVTYGALALAHGTLDILRVLHEKRSDHLAGLDEAYADLGALVAGHQALPELPNEPPEALTRVMTRLG